MKAKKLLHKCPEQNSELKVINNANLYLLEEPMLKITENIFQRSVDISILVKLEQHPFFG